MHILCLGGFLHALRGRLVGRVPVTHELCDPLAPLLAQPTAGALKSLEALDLRSNEITDAGCATLTSALRGGALPALKEL